MHNDPLAVPSNSRQSVPEHLSACLQPALYTQPQTIVVISYQPACAQAWIVACQQCVCPVLCYTHTHIASASLQVVRLLGTGGEGETWLCIDQRNKQEVAIKLVRRPIPRSITQIIQVCAMNTEVQGRGGWLWLGSLSAEKAGAQQEVHIKFVWNALCCPAYHSSRTIYGFFLGGGPMQCEPSSRMQLHSRMPVNAVPVRWKVSTRRAEPQTLLEQQVIKHKPTKSAVCADGHRGTN